MNQIHRERLEILAEDRILLEAISVVFDEELNKAKPDINKDDSNNLLGEKFRTYEEATKIVKESLKTIINLKIDKKPNKTFNKER